MFEIIKMAIAKIQTVIWRQPKPRLSNKRRFKR